MPSSSRPAVPPSGPPARGTLTETEATVLARAVVDESMQRTGIAPKDFDDLILSESSTAAGVIARYVALEAGLENVPAWPRTATAPPAWPQSRRRRPPSWPAWTAP
jgi:acetyl-CoA acetyltransferase